MPINNYRPQLRPLLLSGLSLCSLPTIATTFIPQPYLRADAYVYAQPTSIGSLLNGFDGSFRGGKSAFAHAWLEIGARIGNWEVGLVERYDYDMSFSKETAELHYTISNKQPLDIGRDYDIDLTVRHQSSSGLRIGYNFQPTDYLHFALGLSYLQGKELMSGRLDGTARAITEKDYDFAFHTDLYYSKDPLFEREAESPRGSGYSLDLRLDLELPPHIGLHIDVKDVYGYIDWRDAPHTLAEASSNNKSFDENGYVKFQPVMSGWESYRNYRQYLSPFGNLSVDYAISDKTALIYSANVTRYTYFWGVGAQQKFFAKQRGSIIYYPDIHALELAYSGPFGAIKLATDATSLEESHVWHIQGNVNYWY